MRENSSGQLSSSSGREQFDTVVSEQQKRTVRHSCLRAVRENSSRWQLREFTTRHTRRTRTCLERDINREQHRSSDKSYGTTGRQRNQPGATTTGNGPSYESHSRTTQNQGRHHSGIRMTTRHHQPRLVCTRSLQH